MTPYRPQHLPGSPVARIQRQSLSQVGHHLLGIVKYGSALQPCLCVPGV